MNFLVKYRITNGRVLKRKTYTYVEAHSIIEHAVENHFKDISVIPLNETASIQLVISQALYGSFYDALNEVVKCSH